jgi:GT2 family glycosyltransferase
MDPQASIIVPTRARAGYLDVALASIAPQAAAAGAEVLVVDDGPAAATREVALRHGARYVAHETSRGLNAARNTGIDSAHGRLLVFVDDDVAVHPGWLAALLRADASAEPDVGVLTGPIRARFEDHRLRTCGREEPPITTLDLGPGDRDAPHAWGANMTVRRDWLERVGRFDESRELYGDEQEWQRRMRAAGGRIRYVAGAGLDHRRAGDDARLRSLARAAYRRGAASRRFDAFKGSAPSLGRELAVLVGCALHPVRYRCLNGIVLTAHSLGRVRAMLAFAGRRGAAPAGAPSAQAARAAPATGTPATGDPATDTPATGTPATGSPATGTPATGNPATGTIATDTPATGTPATGTPAIGPPATGTPAAGAPEAGAAAAGAVGEDPDFLSGESGTVRGRQRVLKRAANALLDLEAAPRVRRLDRAARATPARRRVLVLGIERPGRLMRAARIELHRTRHAIAMHTIAMGEGGKFQHLNALLEAHPAAGADWLVVIDDDVVLPRGFLDRFVHCAEEAGLVLAQPAHRLHSHAAWAVTRRRPASAVRESRFAEIGPVTAFAARSFPVLLPFPDLRMGWGLDAHWAALAREQGWPVGIVDATPILHTTPVGGGYARAGAVAEAEAFLAGRPYVTREEARWSRRVL